MKPQVIAVTGGRGFIGTRFRELCERDGRTVLNVTRGEPGPSELGWSPRAGRIDAARLESVDAVVNLAGEPIVGLRWTSAKRERILESRTLGTTLVAETISRQALGPRILGSMSAVGYYGDRGAEVLDERSESGEGFLADVCRQWEAATAPAREANIAVSTFRMGLVLDREEGALSKMLPAFRAGLGGRIGSGEQYVSWIHVEDAVRAILFAIDNEVRGPLNVTAPDPVTNVGFATALGEALRRPTAVPAPAFAIKAAMGQMGEETLLWGQRAVPQRLLELGFEFRHAEVGAALRDLLD